MTYMKYLPIVSVLLSATSFAGGFDNSYHPDSIYFGASRVEGSVGWTEVNVIGDLTASNITKTTNDVYVQKVSPVGGARYNFSPNIACSIQTQKPYRANTRYDQGLFPGMPTYSSLETQLDTLGCGYSVDVSAIAKVQLIAGVNRLNGFGGFGTDMSINESTLGNAAFGDTTTITEVRNLKFKEGYFGMLGVGYEIPDYAVRLSLMYYPQFKTSASGQGVVVTDGVDSQAVGASVDKMVVSPQRFQLHLQSGIHPKWLVYAGFIYAQWSKVPSLTVNFSEGLNASPSADAQTALTALFYAQYQAQGQAQAAALTAAQASTNSLVAASNNITTATAQLFQDDAHYFYMGVGHMLTDSIKLTSGVFYEPERDNPVTGIRTPSRGGVVSALLGASYDINKHLTVGGRYNYIRANPAGVNYTGAYSPLIGDITGDFPASVGRKLMIFGEYKL